MEYKFNRHGLFVLALIAVVAMIGATLMVFEPSLLGPGGLVDPKPLTKTKAALERKTTIDAPAEVPQRERVTENSARERVQSTSATTLDARAPIDEPEARLVLRIVDEAGQPVEGVGVHWLRGLAGMGYEERSVRGRSDANGLLPLPEAERDIGMHFGGTSDGARNGRAFTGLGIRPDLPFDSYTSGNPFARPGAVWLDAMPNPDAPVEVVLPPFGFVRFEWDPVFDATGAEVEGFVLNVGRSDGHSSWNEGALVEPGANAHVHGPIGISWEVSGTVSSPGIRAVLAHGRGRGPTEAGETVTVRLEPLVRDLVRLRGRFVDPDGTPTDQRVLVTFEGLEASHRPAHMIVPNADGAFDLQCERDRIAATAVALARFDDRKPRADLELDLTDPTRRNFDLGTIVLVPSVAAKTTLVSGRVTDTSDKPLPGVYISVYAHATMLAGEPVEHPDRITLLGRAQSNTDGHYTFAATAEIPSGELEVQASLDTPKRTVPVGSSGVNFAL